MTVHLLWSPLADSSDVWSTDRDLLHRSSKSCDISGIGERKAGTERSVRGAIFWSFTRFQLTNRSVWWSVTCIWNISPIQQCTPINKTYRTQKVDILNRFYLEFLPSFYLWIPAVLIKLTTGRRTRILIELIKQSLEVSNEEHVLYTHAESAVPRKGCSLSFQINQRETWETHSI